MFSLSLRVKRKGLPEQEQTCPVSKYLAAQLVLQVGMRMTGERGIHLTESFKSPFASRLVNLVRTILTRLAKERRLKSEDKQRKG